MREGGMTISAFAAAANVSVETIRFYQRRGLIREPGRPFGAIRRYDSLDVARVRFVKSAQRLGFSLAEVAGLLQLEDGTHCDAAEAIAREKLIDVREKLADLHTIERSLSSLVTACHRATGRVRCPLIAALEDDERTTIHQVSAAAMRAGKKHDPLRGDLL